MNVVPIRLPPLRERKEDIPDLVRHFLALAQREGLPEKSMDAAAMQRLTAYNWPGNIRELENLVKRLVALYSEEVIGSAAIDEELLDSPAGADEEASDKSENLSDAVERHLRTYFAAHGDNLPPTGLHDRVLREIERPLIMLSLDATKGNQLKAASMLGLNRNTLRKKIGIPVVRSAR
mgnify:FL=1